MGDAPKFSWQYRVIEAALITAIYFILARIGQLTAIQPGNVTAVYPPAGFAVACVLLWGGRVWPGLLLGQFIGNVWAFFDPGSVSSAATTITVGVMMSLGAVLQALVGAQILQRLCGTRDPFQRVAHVFLFAASAIAACLISSTFGVTSLCGGGIMDWSRYGYTWWTWYLGDAAGYILVAPVVFVLAGGLPRLPRSRLVEAGVLAVGTMAIAAFEFLASPQVPLENVSMAFLLMLPIMWGAIRLGHAGVAISSLILSFVAVVGTVAGRGPFSQPDFNLSLLSLVLFVSISNLVGLVLAAAERQRNLSEQALAAANEGLELRIAQRTQELRLQTDELRRANCELEEFSYSVSHDLKAPLRAMMGFSEILVERYLDVLDERGQRYLRNVVESTKHLEQLIGDLLAYARLGKGGVPLDDVPLTRIVDLVTAELSQQIAETDAILTIAEDLPVVRGNHTLLKQVFLNLLNNALTYHRHGEAPDIEVRWHDERSVTTRSVSEEFSDPAIVVEVIDNGIGIAPEYQAKIFNIFQRLHSDEDYPGTGIGLAIVKKATQILGGNVRVESTMGRGSTFSVVLPHSTEGISSAQKGDSLERSSHLIG